MVQPGFPERGRTRHLPSVEAPHPRPKQDHGSLGYRESGNARFQSTIRDAGKNPGRKPEDLLGIGDQTAENLGLAFLETFPFQLGDFLDKALHLLVVTHGLAHTFLPHLGDANLAQLTGLTLH